MRINAFMMTGIELVLCFMSLVLLILTSNISYLYRSLIFLLFELLSCIVTSALLIIQSQVNNSSLLPTIALISYSLVCGSIGTILTMFTVFFLGAPLFDIGTIVLSVYFGFVTFRTCLFTGFKSLLVMIIKSPTLRPRDANIAPIFYSMVLAYFCSFSCITKPSGNIYKWPGFILLGAALGRLIGTTYKLLSEKSPGPSGHKNTSETK